MQVRIVLLWLLLMAFSIVMSIVVAFGIAMVSIVEFTLFYFTCTVCKVRICEVHIAGVMTRAYCTST